MEWSNGEAVVSDARSRMEDRVEEDGRTALAVTLPVGNENVVVGWSLGPPHATKQASMVSKLFSLPAIIFNDKILVFILFRNLTFFLLTHSIIFANWPINHRYFLVWKQFLVLQGM